MLVTESRIAKIFIRIINALTGAYLKLVGIKTLETNPTVFRYNG